MNGLVSCIRYLFPFFLLANATAALLVLCNILILKLHDLIMSPTTVTILLIPAHCKFWRWISFGNYSAISLPCERSVTSVAVIVRRKEKGSNVENIAGIKVFHLEKLQCVCDSCKKRYLQSQYYPTRSKVHIVHWFVNWTSSTSFFVVIRQILKYHLKTFTIESMFILIFSPLILVVQVWKIQSVTQDEQMDLDLSG